MATQHIGSVPWSWSYIHISSSASHDRRGIPNEQSNDSVLGSIRSDRWSQQRSRLLQRAAPGVQRVAQSRLGTISQSTWSCHQPWRVFCLQLHLSSQFTLGDHSFSRVTYPRRALLSFSPPISILHVCSLWWDRARAPTSFGSTTQRLSRAMGFISLECCLDQNSDLPLQGTIFACRRFFGLDRVWIDSGVSKVEN